MAQDFLKNDLIVNGFVTANTLLSSGIELHEIFETSLDHQTSIDSLSSTVVSNYLPLTGGKIAGNVFLTGSVFAEAFNSPKLSLITFDTISLSAKSTISLPNNANDIELVTSTSTVLITAFANGIKGALYVVTNKGPELITITSNEKIYIRNNPVSLTLPMNHSCSLRVDEDDRISIW